jgi:sugar lactone lactonase YvrE
MTPFGHLPVPPSQLGESPFWHPDEGALYWCDIPGKALHRWVMDGAAVAGSAAGNAHTQWNFDCEPASCAPMLGGLLMLAMRDGLWTFDTASGQRKRLAPPPYDPALERFNDGKADPQGRFWVGSMYEPRDQALAGLYRWSQGKLVRMAGDATVSNGLAWSPDGNTMLWSDTKSHLIHAFDFDGATGNLSRQRVFARFAPRADGQPLAHYGGRPDGAAVDAEGCYWYAMYEGQRLLRLAPDGQVLRDLPLPVRCATMPCFGGPDLRTMFITTASANRPADELAAQPLAGRVLTLRVDVPGLPVHFAR